MSAVAAGGTASGRSVTGPVADDDQTGDLLSDLLLIYIVRCWYQRTDLDNGWAQALRDPGITRALTAIEQHPERPWTVETLAREAGSSRAVFARRFHDFTGQPPLGYLTWWRMTTASHLLRETAQPLQAIAAKAGYQNEYAFSRAFKREFGTAPGAYRRTNPTNTDP